MECEEMHRQLEILDENPKEMGEEEQEELEEQQNSGEKRRREKSKGKRPFPTYILEDAIKVPQVIRQFNGGNPWSPDEIAKALEIGNSNKYYSLTASSRDYGFTEGTRSTKTIALASIGRSIVYARSAEEEINGYKQAFFRVPLFKRVYECYDERTLPQIRYLKNTLITEFSIDEEFQDDFYKVYQANSNFLSRLEETIQNKSLKGEKVEISSNKEHSADAFILGELKKRQL
ncbi:MAG: hypothetical protein V7K89_30050 [Nostoc sp.]|uniref:hypothetical protein n=1 Tax=Nostoc sp. TaxID=1180 RepID=UPI002FF87302